MAQFQLKLFEEIGINRKVDVIISDMAPDTTGIKSLDHGRIVELIKSIVRFSINCLRNDGALILKSFSGSEEKKLKDSLKLYFKQVIPFRPESTRKQSKEVYIISFGFNKNKIPKT